MIKHFAVRMIVTSSRRLGVTPEGWIHSMCACACYVCTAVYFPGRRCFVLHVAVIRGTPWTTRRQRTSKITIVYRRFPVTRSSSDPSKGISFRNWGRCSCKISILIRKTATAARIVGWNRRRNRRASWPTTKILRASSGSLHPWWPSLRI